MLSLPHLIYPLTLRVVGAPQMISQPVSSIFFLFSTALWDFASSRPVHSLMLSSHLFLCLPCLLPPFTVYRDTAREKVVNMEYVLSMVRTVENQVVSVESLAGTEIPGGREGAFFYLTLHCDQENGQP